MLVLLGLFPDHNRQQSVSGPSPSGNYWFELHSQQTTYATPEGRELSSDWFSWNEDVAGEVLGIAGRAS